MNITNLSLCLLQNRYELSDEASFSNPNKVESQIKKEENEGSVPSPLLCNVIKQLNPSDADLNFTLAEYIFDRCFKTLKIEDDKEKYYELLVIADTLFSDINVYELHKINNSFKKVFYNYTSHSNEATLLPLVTQLGQKFLDKPIFEILSKPSPLNDGERILNSMKIQLDWLYCTVAFTNEYLNFNNKIIKKIKDTANYYKNELQHNIKSSGFNEYSFRDQSNLYNIHANIIVIDNFIRPIASEAISQIQNSAQIVNDYLFVKLKNKFNIYKCLKTILDKIKKTNDAMFKMNEKLINFFNSNTVSFKNNKKGLIYKVNDEEVENFKELPKASNQCYELLEKSLEGINKKFSNLCNQYELIKGQKSDLEVYHSMMWLMLGDELEEPQKTFKIIPSNKEIKSSNSTNKKNNQPRSIEIKNKSASTNPPKIQSLPLKNQELISINTPKNITKYEEILSKHSGVIFKLSNQLKTDLFLQSKKANLEGNHFEKAKMHSKELRDKLLYSSQNLELFCTAIMKQDLYAIGAIVPILCLDLHLALEQKIKHELLLQGNGLSQLRQHLTEQKKEESSFHNLAELCSYRDNTTIFDQKPFIKDFSDAMLQARYPMAWKHKIQNQNVPNPLKWILYSQNLCESINSGEISNIQSDDLIELCNFVFDSYQNMLQNLFKKFDSSLTKDFETLKNSLIFQINTNTFTKKAIELKKSRTQKNKFSSLKACQDLLKFDKLDQDSLNKTCSKAIPKSILDEILGHLMRIDAVDYLQNHYDGVQFSALHLRNLLMYQWVYELIYRLQGHIAGLGEARWLCKHDLKALHAFTFSDKSMAKAVEDFNIGRQFQYTHEKTPNQSPIVKELFKARKMIKKLDPEDPNWKLAKDKNHSYSNIEIDKKTMKSYRIKMFEQGLRELKTMIEMILSKEVYH